MKKTLYILFFLPILLFSQQKNFPLNREWALDFEKTKVENVNFQGCFKPYITSPDHVKKDTTKSLLYRKLKKESLFIVNDTSDKFYCTIDPLFNFVFDNRNEALYKAVPLSVNTRGFLVRGDIGKNFSFETSFYENQSTFPQYIDNFIKGTDNLFPQTSNYDYAVVPGQGRSKVFKKNGYDYAMTSGYISYSPFKVLNIQLGHGKHFVGDGYRSLLLSDNTFNYPYARITTRYKNIQYTNLYTSFMNLTDGGVKTPPSTERLFQKKVGSFQMLSINLLKHLQLGLFQGMIWEAADSSNRQHVEFNTFDPIIGVNTAVYGLNNKNNVLLGATLKFKITSSLFLYGQYMLDDTYSKNNGGDVKNKYGYQVGFKYFDIFTIKNLHLQAEYNSVRPYSYAAKNPEQSYTHYNQPLAHPLGANFNEAIGFINYRLKDFFIEIKVNYAIKGADSASFNYGSNVFKPDNSFPLSQDLSKIILAQGLKTTIMYQDVHIGYLVNPSTNFNIVLGISNRISTNSYQTDKTQFVYFGIRTSLTNFYYDF